MTGAHGYCTSCGAPLEGDSRFCTSCGQPVAPAVTDPPTGAVPGPALAVTTLPPAGYPVTPPPAGYQVAPTPASYPVTATPPGAYAWPAQPTAAYPSPIQADTVLRAGPAQNPWPAQTAGAAPTTTAGASGVAYQPPATTFDPSAAAPWDAPSLPPPGPVRPSVGPAKGRRGFVVLIAVAVVAVLLAGAGVWYFVIRPSGSTATPSPNPDTPIASAAPTSSANTGPGASSSVPAESANPATSSAAAVSSGAVSSGAASSTGGVAGAAQQTSDLVVRSGLDDRANAGLDTPEARAAIDALRRQTGIALTVVAVDTFGGFDASAWAGQAFLQSKLDDKAVLLAIATDDRQYGYQVGSGVSVSPANVGSVITSQVVPLLAAGNWSDAVVAFATGLQASVAGAAVSSAAATAPPTSSAPPTTPTSIPAQPNPLDLPEQPIQCAPGYIVQIASELTMAALRDHVTKMMAHGTLPPGAKWAQLSTSCAIFSLKVNAFVVYAGPFNGPYEGCSTRLQSPADAFIKGTTVDSAKHWVSCLCPATVGNLPPISAVGQKNVWIGVLQRALGGKLDYTITDLPGDPAHGIGSNWGVYTPDTASAVARFQRDQGLTADGQVGAATWVALQRAVC